MPNLLINNGSRCDLHSGVTLAQKCSLKKRMRATARDLIRFQSLLEQRPIPGTLRRWALDGYFLDYAAEQERKEHERGERFEDEEQSEPETYYFAEREEAIEQ